MMLEKCVIFNLSANPLLAKKIADLLNMPVGSVDLMHFADGEIMARSLDSVRGKNVYIIQSMSPPSSEKIMELLIFIDSIKKAKAKEINLITPYYGYSRQDRIARPREPISARLIADLLNTVGVSHVMTFDLHTPQIQGFFSCPVDNLSPTHLFASYYSQKLKDLNIDSKDIVVVSPDHGSVHRGRDLASSLPNSQLAIVDKRRPSPNEAEVVSIVGDVKNKVCIIVDDIIDTGKTIKASTNHLFAAGASLVLVAATHGIFSNNAISLMKEAGVNDIVITNSIEKEVDGVNVISIAKVIAQAIEYNEEGLSLPPELLAFY